MEFSPTKMALAVLLLSLSALTARQSDDESLDKGRRNKGHVIDSVPYVICKPGTYVIERDLKFSDRDDYAIIIKANDVTIDGAGHSLTALHGISARDVKKIKIFDLTLQELNSTGAATGLKFSDVCTLRLSDITGYGFDCVIDLENSNDVKLKQIIGVNVGSLICGSGSENVCFTDISIEDSGADKKKGAVGIRLFGSAFSLSSVNNALVNGYSYHHTGATQNALEVANIRPYAFSIENSSDFSGRNFSVSNSSVGVSVSNTSGTLDTGSSTGNAVNILLNSGTGVGSSKANLDKIRDFSVSNFSVDAGLSSAFVFHDGTTDDIKTKIAAATGTIGVLSDSSLEANTTNFNFSTSDDSQVKTSKKGKKQTEVFARIPPAFSVAHFSIGYPR